jgi:hypothetical protein
VLLCICDSEASFHSSALVSYNQIKRLVILTTLILFNYEKLLLFRPPPIATEFNTFRMWFTHDAMESQKGFLIGFSLKMKLV